MPRWPAKPAPSPSPSTPPSSPPPPPFDPLEDMQTKLRSKFASLGPAATTKQLYAADMQDKTRYELLPVLNCESEEFYRSAPLGREVIEGKDGVLRRNGAWEGKMRGGGGGDSTSGYDTDPDEDSSEDDEASASAAGAKTVDANFSNLRSAGSPSAPDNFANAPGPGSYKVPGGNMTVAYGHAAVQAGLEALEWAESAPAGVTTHLSKAGVLAVAVTGRQYTGADTTGAPSGPPKPNTDPAFAFSTCTGLSAVVNVFRHAQWEPYADIHLFMKTTLANGFETAVIMGYQYIPPPSVSGAKEVVVEVRFGRTIEVEAALAELERITQRAKLRAEGVLLLSSGSEEGGEGEIGAEEEDEEVAVVPHKRRGRRGRRGRKGQGKGNVAVE